MRTGASEILSRGRRGRIRPEARRKATRKSRLRRIDLEGLEARTLLATIPAASATGAAVDLTGFGDVTKQGNANSPTVAVDPYDSRKLVAVWGVDLSTLSPAPHTMAVIEGAYSSDGGATWINLGEEASFPILDAATIDASPPTDYTQVTNPSVAFDGQGNAYVLALQTSGADDGALTLTKFDFSGTAPQFAFENTVYQWVAASDAATSPALAIDSAPSNPPAGVAKDPHANNIYVAWASIDHNLANPNVYGTNFNPDRAEVVVSSDGGNSFSGIVTANTDGNYGPQLDTHPQLVVDQNAAGRLTVAWDDAGTGAKASPAFDELMSNLVQAGDSYQFSGPSGAIASAGTTSFTTSVSVPNPAAITDLTVSVALIHPTDANLSLVLVAPNGDSLTLVGGGSLSGADLGVFGHTTGTPGNPGVDIPTVFDDNATRDIFDPTTNGTNGNTAPFIGHFQAELAECLRDGRRRDGSGRLRQRYVDPEDHGFRHRDDSRLPPGIPPPVHHGHDPRDAQPHRYDLRHGRARQ
jgi:hypothetical protein